MKLDEFAFVNQQLASMLKDGIPLEGSLKQLCASMQRGELRSELERLEADLGRGAPIEHALASRKLPELYKRMLEIGAKSNDLPGVLLLLADYYQRMNATWVRLKGLMVYPTIVLFASLALSLGFMYILSLCQPVFESMLEGEPLPAAMPIGILGPIVVLVLASAVAIAGMLVPPLRGWLRWRLPGFREASLAQFASTMALMLKSGTTLDESIWLLRRLEEGSPVGAELGRWQSRLAAGTARLKSLVTPSRLFPPTFLWLIGSADEDLARGFRRAAELYHARAAHRIEMLLYAALPVSVIFLAMMILLQFVSVLSPMFVIVRKLSGS